MHPDPFIQGLKEYFSRDGSLAPATISARAGLDKSAIRKMLSGDSKSLKLSSALAIARALEMTIEEISSQSFGQMARPSTVPILGRVGAGAEVLIEAQGSTTLYQVACPAQLHPDGLAAVEVVGDSMAPAISPKSLLFYNLTHAEGVASEDVGRVCVTETVDGNVWVKQIKPGTQPGLYHMISLNPMSDNLLDRRLRWASPVLLVLPPELVEKH